MRFRGGQGLSIAFLVTVALVAAGALMAMAPDKSRPPNALWWVVHNLCVTDQRLLGVPAPCLDVNLSQGWALVKDTRAPTHLLLVPTRRISGIESPALLAPDAPNYWQFAWNARSFLERLAGRPVPRQDMALVINSIPGRSQNQLHIHLDCVQPEIAKTLSDHLGEIDETWRPLSVLLAGHHVLVRRLDGAQFGARDPFKLMAAGVPGARSRMGQEALAAVGAVLPLDRPGFILITHPFPPDAADLGAGEEILDHRCEVLSAAKALAS